MVSFNQKKKFSPNSIGSAGAQEDSKLVEDAKKNSDEFEKLYEKYLNRVYVYIFKRVGGKEELAQDLTQETFMRGFRGLSRFHVRGYSYLTYLLRIAHNLLVNQYRKRKEAPLSNLTKEPEGDRVSVADDMDREIDSREIRDAIAELPKQQRDLLEMRYQDELSIREIARKTGKSENATKLSLSRTRKLLAKTLEESRLKPGIGRRADKTPHRGEGVLEGRRRPTSQ